MLLSQQRLRQILGALWLIDGLLQLQPYMFTLNLVYGIMLPTLQNQPAPVAALLQWLISGTEHHLVLVNLLTAAVQLVIGLLLLTGRWVKGALIFSFVWALIVWFAFEGAGLLLTGQASIINGAPGAFLLYIVLGLAVYPQRASADACERGWLSRVQLRWFLAGLWCLLAILQLQPPWWVPGEISGSIAVMIGSGGLNGALVDPILAMLANLAAQIEIPLNCVLIFLFLTLGIGLFMAKGTWLLPFLIASIVVSLLIWWGCEALGNILTGLTTDANSGPLLIIIALACWPRADHVLAQRVRFEQYSATADPIRTISIILCGKIEWEACPGICF